jgi:dihydrofolate synthase/folylpolyglutamate synthase
MSQLTNQSPDAYLTSFDQFGIHLGLDNIQNLLRGLDHPHQKVPIIHIAGTNGKGSVCAFLLSILKESGYRVGRYTSPHLRDWHERITINGEWISDQDLKIALQQVQRSINPELPPTQFEVITAAMWWYFADQQVDIAIIETGLGGRLDATNVCDRPLVTVITSISLDHCQQLGNTLGAIASEKAGIIKPKCPVVIAENEPEAIASLQTKIKESNSPITWVSAATRTETGAVYQGLEYSLPLLGDHQLINSAIAIAAITELRNQGWQISDQKIQSGLAKTNWDGRLQWSEFDVKGKPCKILIDGAHNVSAAKHLRQFVDTAFPNRRKIWIIGILNTKDQLGILRALLHPDDLCHLVPVATPATTSPQDLAKISSEILKIMPKPHDNLAIALESAFEDQQPSDVVILCGSLYLVGEFLKDFSDRHAFEA